MLFITAFAVTYASAATFHVAIVTSTQSESVNRGKSFAGIQTQIHRPIHRAIDLALFESSTTFQAFNIEPSVQRIDVDPNLPLNEQLAAIHPKALTIVDVPKVEFVEIATNLHDSGKW